MAQAAPVQQLKIKSLGHAQLDDRRRRKGKHHGVADLGKFPHGPSGHGADLQVRPVAQLPVLELDECQSRVLSPAGKVDAGNRHAGFHRVFLVLQKIVFDLLHDLLGLLQGRVRRQHGLHQQDSLIFIREIGGGHSLKQESHRRHDQQKYNQVAEFPGEGLADQLQIPVSGPKKDAVKPSEKRAQEPDRLPPPVHAPWAPA